MIILNVPDPQTAQLNRFYTAEFFRSAREHLAPGGLLALQLRSSEDYISPDLAEFLRCIQRTLDEVFPYVVAIPGETIHFFAATRPGVLTDDPQTLIARLQERNLKTQYVREYFIPFRMMPDRMAQVREQLQPLASTPVNRDFEPDRVLLRHRAVEHAVQVGLFALVPGRGAHRFHALSSSRSLTRHLLLVAVLLAFVPARERRAALPRQLLHGGNRIHPDGSPDFSAARIPVRLRLRLPPACNPDRHVHGGHRSWEVGWACAASAPASDRPPYRTIASTQFLLALSGPALIFLVSLLSRISGGRATWWRRSLFSPRWPLLRECWAAINFPSRRRSTFMTAPSSRSKLGTLYAIDLLGGCAGALLLSTYLIPVFGFWKTAWLSAAVNLAPALLAAARVAWRQRCLGHKRLGLRVRRTPRP